MKSPSMTLPVWSPDSLHQRPLAITFPPRLVPLTIQVPSTSATKPAVSTTSEAPSPTKRHKPKPKPIESLELRYARLLTFGDSYTDSQSLYSVFKPPSSDKAWPEHLGKQLGISDQLYNYAISGAKSGHDSNVLGLRGGLLWQMEKFLREQPLKEFFPAVRDIGGEDGDRRTLVGLQAGGINDFLLPASDDVAAKVVRNFEKALDLLQQMGQSGKRALDVVILPLTMGYEMPLYGEWREEKRRLRKLYRRTSQAMAAAVKRRCKSLQLRLWMLDAFQLDEHMRLYFKDSRRPLLLNEWRTLGGQMHREDFMWWDAVHWSNASNAFVARQLFSLLSVPSLCSPPGR